LILFHLAKFCLQADLHQPLLLLFLLVHQELIHVPSLGSNPRGALGLARLIACCNFVRSKRAVLVVLEKFLFLEIGNLLLFFQLELVGPLLEVH
jgi:hypothetical protein